MVQLGWCHFYLEFTLLQFPEHQPFFFLNSKLNLLKMQQKAFSGKYLKYYVYAYLVTLQMNPDSLGHNSMQVRSGSSEVMALLAVSRPHV